MSTAPPVTPTDEIFPIWTDLVNNWRAVDAHWLRDRVVQIFDDATERTSVVGGKEIPGMLSYLKGSDSLEFRKASNVWESVRYPNLTVTSDATTVSLRRTGAGSGLVLKSDGSVEAAVLFTGTGGLGSTHDNTGIALKVGTKTVKLATDATQLTVDSPVKVTGDLESTTTLKAPSGAFTGNVTAAGLTASGTVAAATANVSGTVNAGLLNVGDAEVAVASALAVFRNKQSAANRLSFSATGAAILTGSTVRVEGATTLAGAVTVSTTLDLVGLARLTPAGKTPAAVAGIAATNRAPTAGDNYPDGTIWFWI